MNTQIPLSVAQYLNEIEASDSIFAFIGLDHLSVVKISGGSIENFGLESLPTGAVVTEHLMYLEGLLPGDDTPLVIENTQFIDDRFVDLHFFKSIRYKNCQWVLYIDNTKAAIVRQAQQQERLNEDVLLEMKK